MLNATIVISVKKMYHTIPSNTAERTDQNTNITLALFSKALISKITPNSFDFANTTVQYVSLMKVK